MTLQDFKHVHCIGIGGIGISAIARYCHVHGAKVSGSDTGSSRITDDLKKEGVTVSVGHSASNIPGDTNLVIYTIAVPESNPELREARARGITCLTYPEALGKLTEEYTTIAVCGTHGKTTTTAMVRSMLIACGINPTVIVGSLLTDGGTNFIQGDSKYLVVEACEYKRSFLNLHPSIILITNIDEDHLDYYKDLADIKSAFQSFVDKLDETGTLITHNDVTLDTEASIIDADEYMTSDIKLSVLGDHNKRNAQLVLSLSKALSLPEELARKGLFDFKGTWRRLEYKGVWNDIKMYDDYGHHPAEIKATLHALREAYPHDQYKIIAIFQPHLYSRTKLLLDDFSQAFSDATTVCVLPIYASREQDDGTVSSHDLVEKTINAIAVESYDEIKKYVLSRPHYHTVLVTIGAGDVYHFHERLFD